MESAQTALSRGSFNHHIPYTFSAMSRPVELRTDAKPDPSTEYGEDPRRATQFTMTTSASIGDRGRGS